jgi:hypothetical protein
LLAPVAAAACSSLVCRRVHHDPSRSQASFDAIDDACKRHACRFPSCDELNVHAVAPRRELQRRPCEWPRPKFDSRLRAARPLTHEHTADGPE